MELDSRFSTRDFVIKRWALIFILETTSHKYTFLDAKDTT